MFKRSMLVLATLLTVATLSACGVVAAFIPDQEVSNPLGIHNTKMEATLQDTEPEPIDFPGDGASQQSELVTTAEGFPSANFTIAKEIKNAEDTLPLNPAAMEQQVGYARLVVTKATDDGQAFPDTVAFEGFMYLYLWDGFASEINNYSEYNENIEAISNSYNSSSTIIEKFVYSDQTASFTKDSANCTARRCVYLSTEAVVATLNLNSEDVKDVVAITKPDTASNTVFVDTYGYFVSDPPLPSGLSVALVLAADKATVKF